MKITIDVTSKQCEMILFALAMRSKQAKLSPCMVIDAVQLGESLNRTFEDAFGWDKFDRMKSYRHPIKRVNIACYDLAPRD